MRDIVVCDCACNHSFCKCIGVVSKPARQVPEAGEAAAEGALQHLQHGRGGRGGLHAVQQPGQITLSQFFLNSTPYCTLLF